MNTVNFDPIGIERWSEDVWNLISTGPTSLYGISESLYNNLDKLGTGTVWNGPAAVANYELMKKDMLAIYDYFTKFGNTFTTVSKDITEAFATLETANGASGVKFDTIYDKYFDPGLTTANIPPKEDATKYNISELRIMKDSIDGLNKMLSTAHTNLLSKFNEIDRGDEEGAILSGANQEEKVLHSRLNNNIEESLSNIEGDLTSISADLQQAIDNAVAVSTRIAG